MSWFRENSSNPGRNHTLAPHFFMCCWASRILFVMQRERLPLEFLKLGRNLNPLNPTPSICGFFVEIVGTTHHGLRSHHWPQAQEFNFFFSAVAQLLLKQARSGGGGGARSRQRDRACCWPPMQILAAINGESLSIKELVTSSEHVSSK